MDPERFDTLVRAISQPGTRRRVVGGLAALAFAPLTTAAKPEPAACLPVGKCCSQPAAGSEQHGKGKRKKRGKHHPPSCGKCCSRFGAAGTDGKARCACKGEGIACDNPSQCCSGDCRNGACTACPPNTVFCPDGCANLQTDKDHCGSCEKACDAGQRCQDGSCICDEQSCSTGCCQSGDCQRGTSDGACGNDGAACADCAATGEICGAGGCVCASGVTCGVSGCCPTANDVCHNDQCCMPKTCVDFPGQCGTALDDGCGGTLDCSGDCAGGQLCAGNGICATPCSDLGPCTCTDGSDGDCEHNLSGGPQMVCLNRTAPAPCSTDNCADCTTMGQVCIFGNAICPNNQECATPC